MHKKKMKTLDFSAAIGVSESIVRLWENEASSPRLIHAIRINRFSKNKVKFEEMLNNKDKREIEDAKD